MELDFGASNRDPLVKRVFDGVAGRYDLMNDLMSLGVHRLWKELMVTSLNPRPGQTILDVAGGTGDVGFKILQREGTVKILSLDINQSMLSIGRDRAIDRGRSRQIFHMVGSAEALPLKSMTVDSYGIAFGLRNVGEREKALREAHRVLRPGGKFVCLEFSKVENPLISKLYGRWSNLIPPIGGIVANDRGAYEYLVESIKRFPSQAELAMELKEAGFEMVKWRDLSAGIVALHTGVKL